MPVGIGRPVETGAAFSGIYPWIYQWSSTVDWLFLADNATAAATRRIKMLEYDRSTQTISDKGYILLTFPPATNHTIVGFRMTYDKYTTGTAAASGTAVTGTSTAWQTSRLAVGSRIGFGSTDPSAITTWYEISAIGSDTGITLTSSAGTIADGAYVIEELRAIVATTNATATNGGLFVAKGLRPEIFVSTTIPAATTVDNIRAVYWLADASTVTNTISSGCMLEDRTDWTTHYAHIPDRPSTSTLRIFKYNLRAALTVASGKSTSAWILTTGTQTLIATINVANNGRIGTLNHGPTSGSLAFFLVSTTRIWSGLVSGITSGSTTFVQNQQTEVPPGGVNTYAATAAMYQVEIAGTLDRLIIATTNATGFRSYITQHKTDGSQFDQIMLSDDKQLDSTLASADCAIHGTTNSVGQCPWMEGGLLYLVGTGTTSITNIIRVFPAGADWLYASVTNQIVISPRLSTPNNYRFNSAFTIRDKMIGSDLLGRAPEPSRVYYRTSGISDNSGSWTLITDGDLSGVAGANEIQFKMEFLCISDSMLPGRIYRVGVTYLDYSNDAHYRASAEWTDGATKKFAWRFSTGFGTTVPTLRIQLYNDVTGSLLDDDDSVTQAGTWEKSTNDGVGWSAYDTTDKTNETTYIRYTPASLADDIKVRAILMLD
jgi:hypothetical protein